MPLVAPYRIDDNDLEKYHRALQTALGLTPIAVKVDGQDFGKVLGPISNPVRRRIDKQDVASVIRKNAALVP